MQSPAGWTLPGWGKALAAVAVGLSLTSPGLAAGLQTLHGHVPAVTAHLTPLGRLPGSQRLRLAIGLPLHDPDGLNRLLQALYDPANPAYHQWLSPAEFADRFSATEQDYQAARDFARTNGFTVTELHPNRMLLDVEASVAEVERALHLKLRVYQHPSEARTFYAPDVEPTVDARIPILDISGLSDYGLPHPLVRPSLADAGPGAAPRSGSGSGGTYMGNDFRAAYAPGVTLTGAGQSVGLVQFDGYYASDITKYETQAGLPNVPLQNVLLDGFNGTPTSGPNSGDIEVSLDIEMAISMAPGLAKVILYEGGPSGTANDVLNRMATDNLAKNLSCSWGWKGGPSGTTDQIFQQMQAQGQSFFSASGDSDAYPPGAVDNASQFNAPSDNPYITIVGGTTLTTTGPGGAWVSETVWNWGGGTGSSGGISSYYTIPTWQQGINMTACQGSMTYRNLPDVALTADNVLVFYNKGSSETVGGTSCAAPLWAGFAALANEQAAVGGLQPIGFVNPALYSIGKGPNYNANFHDTTTGNNFSSSSPSLFSAVAGYDLCTGWGTPAGSALINALAPVQPTPLIATAGTTLLAEGCSPPNGAVDPGETVTVSFALENLGTGSTSNLVVTLQAGSGVVSPSGPQSYGVLTASGPAVSRSFSFTASGVCGASIMAALQLQDGTTNLGTATFPFHLGLLVPATTLAQAFDGVTPPSLPSGWSSTVVAGTAAPWVTTSAAYDTAPNSAFAVDAATAGVNGLVSPVIAVSSPTAQLTFRHNYTLEARSSRRGGATYYDGAVLEISIGNGPFTDILAAGGSFVTGGYNATLYSGSGNPYGGRQAWGGSSGGWLTTTVNLPPAAAGQNIQLRISCATDSVNSYTAIGWYVDTLSLQDALSVCCTTPVTVAPSISTPPAGQTVVAGTNVTFSVSATATPPPGYQWQWNGANQPGATASSLTLTDVQPAQAGTYTVVLSNSAGSLTSAPAVLRVLVSPSLSNLTLTGGTRLSFSSITGLNYTLEYKVSLTEPTWTPLPPSVLGTGGTITLQDTNAPAPQRFYRVRCD